MTRSVASWLMRALALLATAPTLVAAQSIGPLDASLVNAGAAKLSAEYVNGSFPGPTAMVPKESSYYLEINALVAAGLRAAKPSLVTTMSQRSVTRTDPIGLYRWGDTVGLMVSLRRCNGAGAGSFTTISLRYEFVHSVWGWEFVRRVATPLGFGDCSPRYDSDDAAVVELARVALLQLLGPVMLNHQLDADTRPHGWMIGVPPTTTAQPWSRVTEQLRSEWKLRDTTATDSTRTTIVVKQPRIAADTFTVMIAIGGWMRCSPTAVTATTTTHEVRSVRREGVWGEVTSSELTESLGAPCSFLR